MQIVLLTALGVGGASVIGAIFGFIFKKATHKFSDIVLSFAAGVMLSASVIGLILPSLDYGGKFKLLVTVLGVFCGALCVNLIDKLVPHLHRLTGVDSEAHPEKQEQLNRVILFVIAIAIHNLPEGIAAGVGFGTGDSGRAITIAGGIALQNIPEGSIVSLNILHKETRVKAILGGFLSGVVEPIASLLAILLIVIIKPILPYSLAFAAGAMIYVVVDELITNAKSIYGIIGFFVGFIIMMSLVVIFG